MTDYFALKERPPYFPERVPCHILEHVPQGFYLAKHEQRWALCCADKKPIHIDFTDTLYRRGGKEYLPKAFKNMNGKRIFDATAGWGRDSWLLACRGFQVTLCERQAYLYALLAQAIELAKNTPETAATAAQLTLVYQDSCQYLRTTSTQFDAIYLDPMYPPRQKSAKVKKEMAILHILLDDEAGDTAENLLLLQTARARCARVVVKRPHTAPPLGNQVPRYCIDAPNTRFDVYLH